MPRGREEPMSGEEAFSIFHLSDTHYDGENPEMFALVLEYLVEIAPRYVLMTGDVVEDPHDDMMPFTKMLKGALTKVEKKSGTKPVFLIVPGNHDFYWKGTYGFVVAQKFYRAFPESERSFHFSKENALTIAPFDSNRLFEPRGGPWRSFLQIIRYKTHGLIIEKDLDEFSENVRRLRRSGDRADFERSLKIAMVHHHPMPTSYNVLPPFADEGFMMLENAGVFMHRLIDEGFDMILHGHRHYPQFCRAVYLDSGGNEKMISVLGCGSSSKSTDLWIRLKGHNFNVIHVKRDGSVLAEQYFKFGTGEFIPSKKLVTIRGPRKGKGGDGPAG
jgi:3',5'-cyclic AMP phosphodiesterase CpdA